MCRARTIAASCQRGIRTEEATAAKQVLSCPAIRGERGLGQTPRQRWKRARLLTRPAIEAQSGAALRRVEGWTSESLPASSPLVCCSGGVARRPRRAAWSGRVVATERSLGRALHALHPSRQARRAASRVTLRSPRPSGWHPRRPMSPPSSGPRWRMTHSPGRSRPILAWSGRCGCKGRLPHPHARLGSWTSCRRWRIRPVSTASPGS